MNGFKLPDIENSLETCMNKIYEKLRAIPKPICIPIPPRIFRVDKAAPIIVIMKTANGEALLLYNSIK
jgi:hypothetical protein